MDARSSSHPLRRCRHCADFLDGAWNSNKPGSEDPALCGARDLADGPWHHEPDFPYFDGGILFTAPTTQGAYDALRRVFGAEFGDLPNSLRQLLAADFNDCDDDAETYRQNVGRGNLRRYVDALLAGAEVRARS